MVIFSILEFITFYSLLVFMKILENVKKWVLQWIGIVMVLWVCWFAYAASVWTVTTGDPLTADMWNAVASNYS